MPALPRGGRPAEALAAVQASIDAAWRDCLAEYGVTEGTADELGLPDLLEGRLPSTPQAQALKAAINKLTDDERERVTTFDEVTALAAGR
jgi:hypothetical protein